MPGDGLLPTPALDSLSTPALIAFLRSSFQESDFAEVCSVLTARESSMEARILDLESKLKKERERSEGLEFSNFVAAEELEKSRRKCLWLEEQASQLRKDIEALREREEEAKVRIEGLLEEGWKKEEEMKRDLRYFEKEKVRALEEAEISKRMYEELALWLKEKQEVGLSEPVVGKNVAVGVIERNLGFSGRGDGMRDSEKQEAGSLVSVVAKNAVEGVIEIVDSDDEKDVEFRGGIVQSDAAEEEEEEEEDDFLPVTRKRKGMSRVVYSESEDDDYDEEADTIPIGQLVRKRTMIRVGGSEIPAVSKVNCASGCDDVQDSVTSRKRVVGLKQCDVGREVAKGSSFKLSDAQFVSPSRSEEKAVCFNGLHVQCSHCVGSHASPTRSSKVEASSVSSCDKFLSKCNLKKGSKRWDCQRDMLFSLLLEPELCMNAICAMYRLITFPDKSDKGLLHGANGEFSTFDTYKASRIAEFLLDGDPQGPLKRSVKELEEHDQQGLEDCKKLAIRYCQQLFMIYQSKRDPYFYPS